MENPGSMPCFDHGTSDQFMFLLFCSLWPHFRTGELVFVDCPQNLLLIAQNWPSISQFSKFIWTFNGLVQDKIGTPGCYLQSCWFFRKFLPWTNSKKTYHCWDPYRRCSQRWGNMAWSDLAKFSGDRGKATLGWSLGSSQTCAFTWDNHIYHIYHIYL